MTDQEAAFKKTWAATLTFRIALEDYPSRDIAEYTRLKEALDDFMRWAQWCPYNKETGEEGKDVREIK